MMNTKPYLHLLVMLALLACANAGFAQSCEVGPTVGEIKQVQIDGQTWFAMSRGQLNEYAQMRKSVTGLKASIAELKDALEKREKLLQLVQSERDDFRQRATQYDALAQRYAERQKAYDALNQDYQQALAQSIGLNQQYDAKAGELIGLAKKYDDHVTNWRTHAEECRQLATQATGGDITFDVGLGLTSDDNNAAGIIGVSIGQLKAWGFLQNGNSGVLVGTSFNFK